MLAVPGAMAQLTSPLTALEIASGYVGGGADGTPPAEHAAQPADALRDCVLAALRRPPCLVSFSGGYDSSVVLAVAVDAARRAGLPPPVPITWRFPRAPRSAETEWQEAVVAELGLSEWERRTPEADDELDLVGPVAMRVLERHGVRYPANAFLHAPLLERARGGTLLTGVGGDELLGHWRWRRPRTLRGELLARLPTALRARRDRRRSPVAPMPWLRGSAEAEVVRAEARERAAEPARWDRRVAWQARRRRLLLGLQTLDALAADAGARVISPFADPRFLAALASAGGRHGFGDRATTLAAVLGPLLPRALAGRDRKALFGEVFWAGGAERVAAAWDGEAGIDPALVDAAALREIWSRPGPDPRTALLLQQVALAARDQR